MSKRFSQAGPDQKVSILETKRVALQDYESEEHGELSDKFFAFKDEKLAFAEAVV